MSRTLTKPWNRATPGTVITTEIEEALRTGALLVDPARFAHLEADGFFEPEHAAETAEESTPPVSSPNTGKEETSTDSDAGNVQEIAGKSAEREASFPTAPPPLPPVRKVTR